MFGCFIIYIFVTVAVHDLDMHTVHSALVTDAVHLFY